MAREINLVPDIKDEMIRTLKLRNFIFFLCIAVSVVSAGIALLTGVIAGGQQLALDSKKATIDHMSRKLNDYTDLNDFLTIKDQLSNVSTLTSNKQVLSRTFNTLSALLPKGADSIQISEINVSLADGQPIYTFDANANAGSEPYIDYNVLDSFKKSMQYMRYDYGEYVDRKGATIPAYCMIEFNPDGSPFSDSSKGIYALWTINGEGCNPSDISTNNFVMEDYQGQQAVRIWRTPQFDDWYKEQEISGQPYMGLDGTISNIEHFNSSCTTYSGDNSQSSAHPKWTPTNDSCVLVPDGTEGISISDSSNGRNANDELVLRFSATILINPEVYKFTNNHMLAVPPTGRYNVTDSYVQIKTMFGERAADCAEGDATCNSDVNKNGEE